MEEPIILKSYQDDLTLDEIQENDVRMSDEAISNADYYNFSTLEGCVKFMGTAVKASMESLGIRVPYMKRSSSKVSQRLRAIKLDRVMNRKGVKVERRKHYEGEELWRNGLYITANDTLVAFVSEPMTVKDNPSARIISPIEGFKPELAYGIITNAPVDARA